MTIADLIFAFTVGPLVSWVLIRGVKRLHEKMSIEKMGNRDVLEEAEDHWYKIAGMLLQKLLAAQGKGCREPFFIDVSDIEAFANLFGGETPAILFYPKDRRIMLQLLPMSEAMKKTRQ